MQQSGLVYIYDLVLLKEVQHYSLYLFGKAPDQSPLIFCVEVPIPTLQEIGVTFGPDTPINILHIDPASPLPSTDEFELVIAQLKTDTWRFNANDLIKRWIGHHLPSPIATWTGTRIDQVIHRPTFTISNTPWVPQLSVVSLDIETACFGDDLYCIGVDLIQATGDRIKQVFMIGNQDNTELVTFFPSEADLLIGFMDWIAGTQPDVIVGWHIHEFDIRFIEQKCAKWGVPFRMGRIQHEATMGAFGVRNARSIIPGRLVLDGAEMIVALAIPTNGFSLESVAQQYLGEGKLIRPDQDKVAEIERLFRENRIGLAQYNIRDCELVSDLIVQLGLLDTLIGITIRLGCTLSQATLATSAIEPYIYRKLIKYPNLNLPAIQKGLSSSETPYRIKPILGHHIDVIAVDFKHPIGQAALRFGIDIVSFGMPETAPHSVPGHLTVSRTHTCYPDLLEFIDFQPNSEKRRQLRHYLFRSIEESIVNPTCPWFHDEVKRGAKAGAAYTLRLFADLCRQRGDKPILLLDGALYISRSTESPSSISTWLNDRNAQLSAAIASKFPNASPIDLPLVGHYQHVYVGAKAAWTNPHLPAVIIGEYKDQALGIRGINIVPQRTTYPPLFNSLLNDLFITLFSGASPMEWARRARENLKNGTFDPLLVYSKRIRKSPKRYGKQAPNHIIAARLARKFSGNIDYVISPNGPFPVTGPTRNIDYTFYDHQVIKPLLKLICNDGARDQIDASDPNQMELF